MRESEKIAYARKGPAKPRIYRLSIGSSLSWVVEASPVLIHTNSWDAALKALCDLYKYGVGR